MLIEKPSNLLVKIAGSMRMRLENYKHTELFEVARAGLIGQEMSRWFVIKTTRFTTKENLHD